IFGGLITTFFLSYENSQRIYVALKDGEIYKSEDLGAKWEKIAKINLPAPDPCSPCSNPFSINSIVEVLNGKIIYIITTEGVFKSDDYGKTFKNIDDTFPLNFYPNSIIVSKENPDKLIITGESSSYRSLDSGSTWLPIPGNFYSIQYNPSTNELFAISSTDNRSLFKSNDFGENWEKLTNEFNYVSAITVSLGNPTAIIVTTQDGKYYISKDSGKSFKEFSLPYPMSPLFCVSPKDPNYIVAFPQYAKTFSQAELLVSKDGGQSFNEFKAYNVMQDAKFTLDGSKLFVLTPDGVLFSSNDGFSFHLENVFPEVYFKDIVVSSDRGIVLTNGAGFTVDFSNNTATALNKDGFDFLVTAAISKKDTSIAYVSSWARLFELVGTNLKPTKDIESIQSILISPNNPAALFVRIVSGEEGVSSSFVTYDKGKTLQSLSYPQKPYQIISVAFDDRNPQVIYAIGTEGDNGELFIYKSQDDAKTFEKIASLPNVTGDSAPYIAVFDSTIYIYGWNFGVLKSDDFGKTFKSFNKGLSNITNLGVVKLAFNPKTKDLFLLTYDRGLFVCKNGSDTWLDISGNFERDKIKALAVDEGRGSVYVCVDSLGVFKIIP
ncbi:MAG: VPS10 domain-containing protein, partial [Fervidobacterium sp.]